MKDPTLESRLENPNMEYYHTTYRTPRWDGEESLVGKRICVYVEQGHGDCIQMARYFKHLRPAHVTIHCPLALCSLLREVEGVDDAVSREMDDPPEHDLHVLSLSLPFLTPDKDNKPYLAVPAMELPEVAGYRKIGIAWEGNPNYPKNSQRSCPLRHFKKLERPDTKFFALQIQIAVPELVQDCEDMEILGVPINDFYDTAMLIQTMDFVVCVDTAPLHLAGALGKKAYGLLAVDHDKRWTWRRWYDSVEMWRQPRAGDWEGLFESLPEVIHDNCCFLSAPVKIATDN